MGGSAEGSFIAEIIVLLLSGRGLGEVLQRYGQPAIMGQLIGGILLGPSLLGWLWPEGQRLVFDPAQKSMIDAVSQLGILMLLLLTGMETDLKLVRRVGKACMAISTTGVIVPFVCGFALAQFLPATASAASRTARRSRPLPRHGAFDLFGQDRRHGDPGDELHAPQSRPGHRLVGHPRGHHRLADHRVTFGIATTGKLEVLSLLKTIAGVGLFMAFSFTLGRRIVFALIRWSNDTFRSEFPVVTMILIIMGVMALITNAIGVHTVLGAFVAGILVGNRRSCPRMSRVSCAA
jgi:Kef-type K+ transport system membrane component KefB